MATVLVVDDDEVTRLLLGRILEDVGHQVVYAGDGESALKVFQVGRYDAVFTDLAMPELNGLRLIQLLRELDWNLPVIAMSGTNAEQLLLAEDYGALEVLYKPLDPEGVLEALDHAMAAQNDGAWDFAWG